MFGGIDVGVGVGVWRRMEGSIVDEEVCDGRAVSLNIILCLLWYYMCLRFNQYTDGS